MLQTSLRQRVLDVYVELPKKKKYKQQKKLKGTTFLSLGKCKYFGKGTRSLGGGLKLIRVQRANLSYIVWSLSYVTSVFYPNDWLTLIFTKKIIQNIKKTISILKKTKIYLSFLSCGDRAILSLALGLWRRRPCWLLNLLLLPYAITLEKSYLLNDSARNAVRFY